jgi:ribonuclease HII
MLELKLIQHFPQQIIALDEVGRSPLSGPVVIGALRALVPDAASLNSLLRSLRRQQVKDSKLLTHQQRARILEKLNIQPLSFRQPGSFSCRGIELSYLTWEMDHAVIDQENILRASLRGMQEAAEFLGRGEAHPTTLLIDGPMSLPLTAASSSWRQLPLIQGDVKSALIGLAAIIAKEQRDGWMRTMHELYPHYGFADNFGYPTRQHRQALALHGPCPIHRLSFNPLKQLMAR